MSTPKRSAAAQFGLPKVQTGSGFSTPKLVYPLIPGFDQEKSEKYWRQMGKILFAENIQTQLIPLGYIDLDKAYLESKNEKILALRKTMGDACKSPYCRHKLWSGMLKIKNSDLTWKKVCSNNAIQSFIWIVPYRFEKTLPEDLKKQLADIMNMPDDVNKDVEIKNTMDKYFEKGYPSMDCTIYYAAPIGEKIATILTEMQFGTDINAISQEDVVQCFIAGDLTSKPFDKDGQTNPGWNINVDDLWFFRPV